MVGTSTDRCQLSHYMERPATVAGFRPSITSQVEVSKSIDECSDLTHGECMWCNSCNKLFLCWRLEPSDMWQSSSCFESKKEAKRTCTTSKNLCKRFYAPMCWRITEVQDNFPIDHASMLNTVFALRMYPASYTCLFDTCYLVGTISWWIR